MLGAQINSMFPNRAYNFSFDPSQYAFGQGIDTMSNLGNTIGNAFWNTNLLNSQNINEYRNAVAGPAFAYQTAVDTQKLKNDALANLLQGFGELGGAFGGLGSIQSDFGQGVKVGARPTNTARFAAQGQQQQMQQQPNALARMLGQF